MKLASILFANEDAATQEKLGRLLLLLVFALLIFTLGVTTQTVNPALAYDRSLVLQGELWRLITCNIVHLSSNHMFMNLSVYVLAVLIFGVNVSLKAWYATLAICCASVGIGVLFLYPQVSGYAGLSGALYGIVVFGLLQNIRHNTVVYLLVYAYITYKVLSQQTLSYDPAEMMSFIGGNIIPQSHLIGLVAGNLCAVACCILRYLKGGGSARLHKSQ